MKKTRLTIPETWPFSTEMTARITDMNYGGHMGYDALVGILHEARIRFLREIGCTETDVFGPGLLMVDAVVICTQEIFAGDRMTLEVAAGHLSRTGFDCFYRVLRKGQEAARAKTGMVFFDYETRTLQPAPDAFKPHCVTIED